MASSLERETPVTAGLPQRAQRFLDFVTPASRNEDVRRRAFLLTVILCAVTALSFTCTVITLADSLRLGDAYRGVPWLAAGVLTVIFAGLLALVRRGKVRLVSMVLLCVFALPILYSSYVWGIDLPQALLGDAFLILMAGALFGPRAAFAFSLFFGAIVFTFGMLDAQGITITNRYWRNEIFRDADGIAIAVTLLLFALMSWLANREIYKSLRRAWASEAALKEERDLLEVKVEERTHALRRMQLEKMVQMHKFVEFGKMSSGFFHDLANPLTALSMNLTMMQESDARQGKATYEQLQKALSIMDRIQKYLGSVRRHLQLQEIRTEFNAREELHAVIEILRYKSVRKNVEIVTKLPKELVLFGNPIKFHQLVSNLLSNAIDAYESEPRAARAVEISVRKNKDAVVLMVKDGGCGISAEHLPHIFDPFFTTKDPESGMGIGLATCRSIVEEDLKGTIVCQSTLGGGTCFTVTIPCVREYAAA